MERIAIFLLVQTCMFISCQRVDPPDKSTWIDPHDMLNYDLSSGKMRNSDSNEKDSHIECLPCQENNHAESYGDLEKQANACADMVAKLHDELETRISSPPSRSSTIVDTAPYFQQFVQHMLRHFQLEPPQGADDEKAEYEMTVLLSARDLAILKDFDSDSSGSVLDTHAVLTGMIQNMQQKGIYRPEPWSEWLLGKARLYMPVILQVALVLFLVSKAIHYQVLLGGSVLSLLLRLLILSFFLSIPWNWWRLVQKEMAKTEAEMMKGIPSQCKPGKGMAFYEKFYSYFSLDDDPCHEYTERLMINPIWAVPPTQAIAVTVANFVLEPLEHIGRHLGRFIRSTMAELPIHLQAVIFPFLVVMILMVVMMLFGYRIRLFHFIGFEPSPTLPPLPTNDSASHRIASAMLTGDQHMFPRPATQHVSLGAETLCSTNPDYIDGPKHNVQPTQLMLVGKTDDVNTSNKIDLNINKQPYSVTSEVVHISSLPENLNASGFDDGDNDLGDKGSVQKASAICTTQNQSSSMMPSNKEERSKININQCAPSTATHYVDDLTDNTCICENQLEQPPISSTITNLVEQTPEELVQNDNTVLPYIRHSDGEVCVMACSQDETKSTNQYGQGSEMICSQRDTESLKSQDETETLYADGEGPVTVCPQQDTEIINAEGEGSLILCTQGETETLGHTAYVTDPVHNVISDDIEENAAGDTDNIKYLSNVSGVRAIDGKGDGFDHNYSKI